MIFYLASEQERQANIKIRLRLVIIKKGKLLACYDSHEDFYYYIGGKLEYGETVKQGAKREIREELGEKVIFGFKKILYIRDFIQPENNEHSLELFILGDINKFRDVETLKDPEFADGRKWATWLDLGDLPKNLYPKSLSKKLLTDYKKGFPDAGEYVGLLDSRSKIIKNPL